jgi:hypothetical protein
MSKAYAQWEKNSWKFARKGQYSRLGGIVDNGIKELILNYLLDKCSRYVLQMLQRDIANSHE